MILRAECHDRPQLPVHTSIPLENAEQVSQCGVGVGEKYDSIKRVSGRFTEYPARTGRSFRKKRNDGHSIPFPLSACPRTCQHQYSLTHVQRIKLQTNLVHISMTLPSCPGPGPIPQNRSGRAASEYSCQINAFPTTGSNPSITRPLDFIEGPQQHDGIEKSRQRDSYESQKIDLREKAKIIPTPLRHPGRLCERQKFTGPT